MNRKMTCLALARDDAGRRSRERCPCAASDRSDVSESPTRPANASMPKPLPMRAEGLAAGDGMPRFVAHIRLSLSAAFTKYKVTKTKARKFGQ